jgi:hypothetical protein
MKSADEIVRALQNYASDCGADEACFQCTVAWMCDELGGNAPKIIANTVERLQSKLAAYEDTSLEPEEIPHWISVSERLPDTDEYMLVACKTQKGVVTINRAYYSNGCWHGSGSMSKVTHWMPLPQPPKECK